MKRKRTKLFVFDFDSTLLRTPFPVQGKQKWEEFYGKKYPHRGWWGKKESLDIKVFPELELIEETYKRYKEIIETEPEAIMVLLTSRINDVKNEVGDYLKKYDLKFHKYIFKWWGKEKPDRVDMLLDEFPDINYVEVWDDRDKEINLYEKWKSNKTGLEIKIIKVEDGTGY